MSVLYSVHDNDLNTGQSMFKRAREKKKKKRSVTHPINKYPLHHTFSFSLNNNYRNFSMILYDFYCAEL